MAVLLLQGFIDPHQYEWKVNHVIQHVGQLGGERGSLLLVTYSIANVGGGQGKPAGPPSVTAKSILLVTPNPVVLCERLSLHKRDPISLLVSGK